MSQKEIFGNFYQGEVLDLLFSLWASGGCKFDNLIIFDLIIEKIRLRFCFVWKQRVLLSQCYGISIALY